MMIEICAGSFEDCLVAEKGGAHRIELNSALELGGLTPSLSVLQMVKEKVAIPIVCMCRPRGGGFHYSDSEIQGMYLESKILLENGADGIVFGFLDENGNVDVEHTKAMVSIIHRFNKIAIFHRAFDVAADPFEAIKALIACGVDRVLTSGQKRTAMEGIELIACLQKNYGDKIEILPGSGINAENIREIIQRTEADQVHSSCKAYGIDCTTEGEAVSFACCGEEHKNGYQIVKQELVEQLVNVVARDV